MLPKDRVLVRCAVSVTFPETGAEAESCQKWLMNRCAKRSDVAFSARRQEYSLALGLTKPLFRRLPNRRKLGREPSTCTLRINMSCFLRCCVLLHRITCELFVLLWLLMALYS